MAGAMHIRNVWSGSQPTADDGARQLLFMLREMFKVSDWVEDYFDADGAWTSNILLTINDLQLAAASPTQVYSAIGGFTAGHEGLILAINGNDTNRGLYNIRTVIDSNTALIDERCRVAAWADETLGAGGAWIFDPRATLVSNNVHIVWREPTRGFQVDFWAIDDDIYGIVYPYGDYLTTNRPTANHNIDVGYNSGNMRFNAFLGDPAGTHYFCLFSLFYDGQWSSLGWGELSSVAAGDNYPAFIQELCVTGTWGSANYSTLRMLNEVDAQVDAYPLFYKRARGYTYEDWRERENLAQKLNGTRAKQFRPQVMARDGGSGMFMRGNHPMEFVHNDWPDDEFGTSYWKMGANLLIPRNGSSDIQPLASTTW